MADNSDLSNWVWEKYLSCSLGVFYFKIGPKPRFVTVDETDSNRLTRLWRANRAKRKEPQAWLFYPGRDRRIV